MSITLHNRIGAALLGATALCAISGTAQAAQVFATDLIVQGSTCTGFDCNSGENFGFDTLRLKENNLRIHFDDTSSSGSFPANDWRIIANDSNNGGANYLAIEDSTAGRIPFRVEAGAGNNALYVKNNGNVGLGNSNPVVQLHVTDGNSPALRLEQDGSSGFSAQTWDIAGNEANFFIRDVTHGSALSFRIKPGAPEDSIFIKANGDIGLGTDIPTANLHVAGGDGTVLVTSSAGTSKLTINETSGTNTARGLMSLKNNGTVFMTLDNSSVQWNLQNQDNELRFATSAVAGPEFALTEQGNLTISGSLTTGGTTCGGGGCDRIFDADSVLPTIPEQKEMMFANRHLPAVGPTLENAPFDITTKVGGMLHELEKAHIYIAELHGQVTTQEEEVAELRTRLSEMDALRARLDMLEQTRN
ncbi:hypothetical protein [Puniceibacterium sp. IMCC21224]|uniref:hypothetical protein n=1 Tax=Puniceibacterium sp. IMCC21224 TaxID=1618204 RepID=UPI00065D4ABA|nr:hypothetical protein [Puniceibacterium sp. IMCC21224]KMK63993.1 hypothetical protein IMCC21224_1651 [Puniceibacterium sp. IMCC21224]